MNTRELQEEILKLKKEKNICILAHSYQSRPIVEVADYVGDSFQLSQMATKVAAKTVIMCGVRFMAETVKILSPDKTVLMPNPTAGCPMAEQMSPEYIESVKAEHPGAKVVAYINTTAALKTICDVCVTSASAVKIVSELPDKDILFIPDINLGSYVARMVPEKNVMLLNGGCPVHAAMTAEDVKEAKRLHPNAMFLVHPECKPEVVEQADFVGSTTAIMKFAQESEAKEFIIGTEISIAEHLACDCPGKQFYQLSSRLLCNDMKATTLVDLYNTLLDGKGKEISLDEDTISKARVCIDKMLELG